MVLIITFFKWSSIFKIIMECFLCKRNFSSDKEIVQHLKIIHKIKNGTTELKCVVSSKCKKTFTTFIPFQNHIKKCYSDQVNSLKRIESFKTYLISVKNVFVDWFSQGNCRSRSRRFDDIVSSTWYFRQCENIFFPFDVHELLTLWMNVCLIIFQ